MLISFITNSLGEAAATPVAGGAGGGPLPAVLFYLFAATVGFSGFSVALARNIVRAAVGLMFALTGMSGLYLLLQAEFIAAVQLVVYVGGTLILIVFGVMLTSKSPTTTYSPKRWEVLWAMAVTAMVVTPLLAIMLAGKFPLGPNATAPALDSRVTATAPAVDVAGTNTPPAAVGAVGETYPMKSLGRALLEPSGYLVPFELVSVLLLSVMIGAAYLAKGRKHA